MSNKLQGLIDQIPQECSVLIMRMPAENNKRWLCTIGYSDGKSSLTCEGRENTPARALEIAMASARKKNAIKPLSRRL